MFDSCVVKHGYRNPYFHYNTVLLTATDIKVTRIKRQLATYFKDVLTESKNQPIGVTELQ